MIRESPENSGKNDQFLNIQTKGLELYTQRKMTRANIMIIKYIQNTYEVRGNMPSSVSSKDKTRGCKINSQQGGFQSQTRENFLPQTTVKS